ncbi:MAG: MarR family transcriptional regulator [Hamadaea sp.]|uniref:MarR family winged helix-turn-helix transcriptional regulator n=1 Tax=Hamadaea sp. TaxID=2024425 RepID=UPI0018579DD7|nr:MarR family transcriptional regulator [Hamadaea sp.]NUR69490.1 MarR family transcriptional regulator [Hamadaea sp.]NUT20726.1 MarR family transcriptional regulator [Hamadaea sp.]
MPVPPPHQPADLARLLTRAERLVSRRMLPILAAEDVTTEGWRVISLLADGAGHPMTDLSEQAFLPPATLTKLIDRLVDDNVVYRRVDDVDRRRIRAHLTPRGRRLHNRISDRLEADLSTLPLSDTDRSLLEQLLAGLTGALDATTMASA